MNNYALYLRKSRADFEAELHGDGETLARHEKALLELAKRMKINVSHIYREIVSGETISARPEMQGLLSDVEQGKWAGILVMEVERLARGNTIDQGIVAQTFKFSGTKIITPMKIYDPNNEFDEEYFEFGLFMSRREYKTINRRLQNGRLASVKEGKYVANQPPYGYSRKKIENDKGFTLEPVEDEANIVKLIFELYTTGELQEDGTYERLGTGLIANKLNAMNVLPKKGKDWSPSTIRDILINPVYIGKIRWNWRPSNKKMVNGEMIVERPRASSEDCIVVNGLHSAIINVETFNRAQSFMSKNPPRPISERGIIKNPLAGIVVCGKCGRKMVRRPYPDSRKCPDTIMCAAKTCNNVSSALHFVEDRIISGLEEWLSEYKLNWQFCENEKTLQQINANKAAIKKLEKEIEKVKTQMNKLHDLLEQGVYSPETFLERSSVNSQKLEQLRNDRDAIKVKLDLDIERNNGKKKVAPKIEKLLEVYKNLKTPKAKNDMLKEVLEKVVYTKDKSGRWHNSPDDFEIILYPKLPDSSINENLI